MADLDDGNDSVGGGDSSPPEGGRRSVQRATATRRPQGASVAQSKDEKGKGDAKSEPVKKQPGPPVDLGNSKTAPAMFGGLTLTRARDVPARWLKLLVFGANGAGKTDCSVRGFGADLGEVAVAALEPQGIDTIMTVNPDAIVPGVAQTATGEWEGGIRNATQLRAFLAYANAGHFKALGVNTLVIDGLTEALNMLADEILERKPEGKRKKLSMDDYGTLKASARNLLKMLRDLPYHVVCTALLDDSEDTESGVRLAKPLLTGSIRSEVGAYFNVVSYLYRQSPEPGVPAVRYAMVDGGDRYSCKGHAGLEGIIRPPASDWLRVMLGHEIAEPLQIDGALTPDEYRRSVSGRDAEITGGLDD